MGLFFNHIPKCGGTSLQSFLLDIFFDQKVAASRLDPWINKSPSELNVLVESGCNIVMAHAGPSARGLFFHDWITVCVIRDPIARFKSAVTHGLNAGKITKSLVDDWCSPEGVLPVTSMAEYIADRPLAENAILEELSLYSIVITTEKISYLAEILYAVKGVDPPPRHSIADYRVNETPQSSKAVYTFPETLGSVLQAKIPLDFYAYKLAHDLQADWISRYTQDPVAFGHGLRKRIEGRPRNRAFSALVLSGMAGWSRLVKYDSSSAYKYFPFRILTSDCGQIRPIPAYSTNYCYVLISFFLPNENNSNFDDLIGFRLSQSPLPAIICPLPDSSTPHCPPGLFVYKIVLPADRDRSQMIEIYRKKLAPGEAVRCHGFCISDNESLGRDECRSAFMAVSNVNKLDLLSPFTPPSASKVDACPSGPLSP